jgi:multiple sugar transport system permease protein
MMSNLNETVTLPVAGAQAKRTRDYGRIAGRVIAYLLAITLGIMFMLPFLWTVSSSFKPVRELYIFPPTWFPSTWQPQNFVRIWEVVPFALWSYNSVLVAALNVVAEVIAAAAVAYGFSRFQFYGRNFFFVVLLSTMMLPIYITIIPRFLIFRNLGWLDTLAPLIVPTFFGGSAFSIFLLRQFFMTIPIEYDEAALMDGASRWHIFWRILLPLSTPALAAVGVFAFVFYWNDFLGPLIILSTPKNFTLTIFLANFSVAYARTTQWNLYMAAALIIILPCLVLFFFSQNAFLKGITITDFKR